MRVAVAVVAATIVVSVMPVEFAAARERAHQASAPGDRPLTIGGRRHKGVYRRGDTVVAVGGFSANGYGYPAATARERREANNARINADATGLYGYWVNGLGGAFPDGRGLGYSNPFWGNGYSANVGYNGTPTDLAFGPGFANRHITDHDPADDDDVPGPTPAELGYSAEPED